MHVRARARWRHDHLLRNSLFLTLSTASQGAFGFVFWLVAAHLYGADEVGVATTLVTATILIAYASLLGFNNAFVHMLPTTASRDEEASTGLTLAAVAAATLAAAYILVAPLLVRQLRPIAGRPLEVIGFVVLVAFSTMNLLTDSVFVAHRAAHLNFAVDGILQSAAKVGLLVTLVGLGAFGVFAATGVAAVAAVVLSVALLGMRFGYRIRPRISLPVVRSVFHYAGATYVADLLMMLPGFVIPIVIVRDLGAAAGGYFYIALQMANALYAVGVAVSQSLFAEASYEDIAAEGSLRRSAKLLILLLVPLAVVLVVGRDVALGIFGADYAANASGALALLALAAPCVAMNHWTATVTRIRLRLRLLVGTNAAFGVLTCVAAAAVGSRGLTWVSGAWLAGNLVIAGVRGGLVLST